jgi:Flp pilus assembly protein CpaB
VKMTQRRMARPSFGGLLATRKGALTLALVCAVAAAGILVFALGRYRSNLQVVTKQATVLVATGNIPKGTAGDAIAARGLYKSMPIVASQLAAGAVSDASVLTGKVVATNVLPGQQLTLSDFTSVSGVPGLLTPDQRAVSVTIDEAHGNTDVLQPGDGVDVYTTLSGANKVGSAVYLLVPNAQVIKVAGAPTVVGGQTVAGGSLVLAVSSHQAPEVALASSQGSLYLALRPANGTKSSVTPTTVDSVIASSLQGGN